MEEFAAKSGISRPTVSKYFNDPKSVRASTRAKIEEALDRYDYRPNIFAMNQNRRLTKNIGIVVPVLADPFFLEIARIIEQRCIDAGFSPTLYSSHGKQETENDILEFLPSMKPAGVLFAPLGRASSRSHVEAFCKKVPTVLFDSNLSGMGEAFVGSDNHSFIEQTVTYLVDRGHEPTFFEMAHPANPNARKRRTAFARMAERHGLDPKIIQIGGHGWDFEKIGREGAFRMFEDKTLTTDTVLCSNDRLAIGLLSAAYELGLTIGSDEACDLHVASHDDHPYSRYTCPSLTTAAHDYDSVSSRAVDTLVDLVEAGGHFATRTETLFPAHLIKRASA